MSGMGEYVHVKNNLDVKVDTQDVVLDEDVVNLKIRRGSRK